MLAHKETQAFLAGLKAPRAAQERYLLDRLITPNLDTEFGRRYDFRSIRTLEDYRQQVPIRDYEGFRADIDRLVAGENGILTAEPVKRFFTTSGSTNKPKAIPVTQSLIRDKSRAFGIYWSFVFEAHPSVAAGRMVTNFSDAGEAPKAAGIPVSSESAYWSQVTAATQRKAPLIPKSVARILDNDARYYTILRILLGEQFQALMALNPSTLLLLFQKLEQHADRLIHDLGHGGLDATISVPDEVRAYVSAQHPAHPERAAALAALRHKGLLDAPHIWPDLALAISWRSPMLAPYLKLLDQHLGGVATRDYLSMASEGVMAVPLEDQRSGGAVAIGVNFYEFMPADQWGTPNASTVWPEALEIGQEYVLILSNGAGLYRYDIGDVFRVRAFHEQTPVIEFLHRAGNTCSLTGEKLTEAQVTAAVQRLIDRHGLSLESFTLIPAETGQPHYVLLLEPKQAIQPGILGALAQELDNSLGQENVEYRGKRRSERLAGPEIWLVAPGSYAARKEQKRAAGAADLQQKPVHLSRQAHFHRELTIQERVHADPAD